MNPFPPVRIIGLAVLAVATLGAGGCATPGPNHIYTVSATRTDVVQDSGPTSQVDVPSFIAADELLTGLAYDPYTDHLFLRLAPGNRIRVVDRPARQIKREFVVAELPETGGGDLAVRPRDGHIFFIHPNTAALVETNRFGEFIRRINLARIGGKIVGVAFDPTRNRLLVLDDAPDPRLSFFDLEGTLLRSVRLEHEGARGHLAYDSASGEMYLAAVRAAQITVFSEEGKVLRQIASPDGEIVEFIDVGQRSFVRVF